MNRHFQVLFGLCIALALAECVFGGSAICTPATCEGPVKAYFQYSNCTGDVYYEPLNRNWDECNTNAYFGYKSSFDEHGLVDAYYYGGALENCDPGAVNASYWYDLYKFGACSQNDYRRDESQHRGRGGRQEHSSMAPAYMYLHNVNASYEAHTFDNQPIMAFPGYETSCPSPDNCTYENGQPSEWWYTSYGSYECQNPSASYSNAKLLPNTCTNYYNYTYYLQGCVDENTLYYSYYTDAACSQPYWVSVWHASCSSVLTDQVHCTATRTEIPSFIPTSPQTPTSAASFNPVSLLIALFACSIALFML